MSNINNISATVIYKMKKKFCVSQKGKIMSPSPCFKKDNRRIRKTKEAGGG